MTRVRIAVIAMVVWGILPLVSMADGSESELAQRTVVLLFTPPSVLSADLEAELRIAGFQPVLLVEDGKETGSLQAAAMKMNASAAVRIMPSGRGVTVFIFDKLRGVNVSTRIDGVEAGARTSAVIAIKTVELLRVGLMQLDDRSPSSKVSVNPDPEESVAVKKSGTGGGAYASSTGLLYLAAAPAIAYGFGGIAPSLHAAITLSMRPTGRVRIFVHALVPTLGVEIKQPEGTAKVRQGLVAAGVTANLLDDKHRFIPYAGLQGGALFFRVEGSGQNPYYGENASGVPFAVNFQLGAILRLGRIVALRADMLVGAVFPEPTIRFDGREVASFGRPMISGSFGVEVRLF